MKHLNGNVSFRKLNHNHEEQDKNERYITKLDRHRDGCLEAAKYSSDRFDVLIISLSTSALVVSIGFVKNIVPKLLEIDTSLLKTSWLILVGSIVANLLSQITGYFANTTDAAVTKNIIRQTRGKECIGDDKGLRLRLGYLNNSTLILNGLSLLLLITGILFMIKFLSNNT